MSRSEKLDHVRLVRSPDGKIKLHLMKVSEKWVKVDISPGRFYGKKSLKRRRIEKCDRESILTYKDNSPLKDTETLLDKYPQKENKSPLKGNKSPLKENGSLDTDIFQNTKTIIEEVISNEKLPVKVKEESATVPMEDMVLITDVRSIRDEIHWETIKSEIPEETDLDPIGGNVVGSNDATEADFVEEMDATDGQFVSERALMQDLEAIPMVVLEKLSAKTLKRYYSIII